MPAPQGASGCRPPPRARAVGGHAVPSGEGRGGAGGGRPAVRAGHPGRLPGLGRPRRPVLAPGPSRLPVAWPGWGCPTSWSTTWSRPPSTSSRGCGRSGRRWRRWLARRRSWPEAGRRTWWRCRHRPRRRRWPPRRASSCGPRRSPPGWPPAASRPSGASTVSEIRSPGDEPDQKRLLAGGAALPAGALEKLLVLLLPHALAALLDERAHGGRQASGCALVWSTSVGGGVTGSTGSFGVPGRGSNPRPRAGALKGAPMTHSRPLAAVVLAAGEGTRMKSSVPKVLHPLCGRPMLLYVVGALEELAAGADRGRRRPRVGAGHQDPAAGDGDPPRVRRAAGPAGDGRRRLGRADRLPRRPTTTRATSSSSPATRRCCGPRRWPTWPGSTTRAAPPPPC